MMSSVAFIVATQGAELDLGGSLMRQAVAGGSVLALLGAALALLPLIRDWGTTRRDASTRTDLVAAAVRVQLAAAHAAETRADLMRWVVDEVKAGRPPPPVEGLLRALDAAADMPHDATAQGNASEAPSEPGRRPRGAGRKSAPLHGG